MSTPILSVVIPLYNAEPYIAQCLDSVFEQDFTDDELEVIIVNDGSEDGGSQVVEEYAHQHPNLHLYYQENQGQSAARNAGMDKACGEYIFFIDADDYIEPHSVKRCIQLARENQLEMLVHGIRLSETSQSSFALSPIYSGKDYVGRYNFNNSACSFLIRRDYIQQHHLRFVVGRFCEDGMFTAEALLRASRVAYYDSYLYHYAERPVSTVTNKSATHIMKMIEDFQYAVEHMNCLAEQYAKHHESCYQRIIERRDSYTLFLMIRVLKSKISYRDASVIAERLRQNGFLPIPRLSSYPGCTYRLIECVVNSRLLFPIACSCYRLLR